ncbi:MAG: ribonuclease [Candidatus Saccharibacteria bacterium]|nr:ribonuclease [Candidatus Saccharibacteria bacterium]
MFTGIKKLLATYGQDRIGQLSAAFSYFTLFSIGPLLLVIISIAGFVLGDKAMNGQLVSQLSSILGPEAADTIQNVVAKTHQTGKGAIGLTIGIVSLLLGASGLFGQLQNSFDQIFKVQADPKAKFFNIVWPKIKGIILLCLTSLLVVVSVVMSALVSAAGQTLTDKFGLPHITLLALNFTVSSLMIGLLLGLLYRVVPNVVVPRRLALVTGLAVGVLFGIGKSVLGFVIGHNSTASAYGAAAALIVLLLWVFYFGQIVFLGAEALKIYGESHGVVFEPKKRAVKQKIIRTTLANPYAKLVESFQRGFDKVKK